MPINSEKQSFPLEEQRSGAEVKTVLVFEKEERQEQESSTATRNKNVTFARETSGETGKCLSDRNQNMTNDSEAAASRETNRSSD